MFFKLLGGPIRGASKVKSDRYGYGRVFGKGPRVKNGPNGGNWRRKHRFK